MNGSQVAPRRQEFLSFNSGAKYTRNHYRDCGSKIVIKCNKMHLLGVLATQTRSRHNAIEQRKDGGKFLFDLLWLYSVRRILHGLTLTLGCHCFQKISIIRRSLETWDCQRAAHAYWKIYSERNLMNWKENSIYEIVFINCAHSTHCIPFIYGTKMHEQNKHRIFYRYGLTLTFEMSNSTAWNTANIQFIHWLLFVVSVPGFLRSAT